MLSRSFLSAKDLHISQKQHEALVKVLGMLERNELVHLSAEDSAPNGFNMCYWLEKEDCGTVGCIGGWAQMVGCVSFPVLTPGLRLLFYPYNAAREYDYKAITVEQAAHALSNYLTIGRPGWEQVLA